MEPLHRAKTELGYTLTMRDRMAKRYAAKLAAYDEKIEHMREIIASTEGDKA